MAEDLNPRESELGKGYSGSHDDLDNPIDGQQSEPEAMELFETFPDRDHASPVLRILDESGIPYSLEENRSGFDPSFANNVVYQAWVLKLPPDRFEEARRELEEALSEQDIHLPPDHYLRDFSVEELLDVLGKADEWSEFDVVMARQMLEAQGIPISDEKVSQMRDTRREELARPSPAGGAMIASAYILALAGGALGIVLGWVLKSSTKTTAFGDKVPSYDEDSRAQGAKVMLIGTVVLVIFLAYALLRPLWLDL